MSQNVEDRRTKKELLELLEDSEIRNKHLTEENAKLFRQNGQWKAEADRNRPKPDAKFKIEIFGELFRHLTYSEAREKAKLLIEAGCVFSVTFE